MMGPHEVVMCLLIKGYLEPGELDPSPDSKYHEYLGLALAHEARRTDSAHSPSLPSLYKKLKVGGQLPRRCRFCRRPWPCRSAVHVLYAIECNATGA